MQPKIAAFSESLLSDPAVKDVVGTSGGADGTTNSFFMVSLKPKAEREGQSSHAILDAQLDVLQQTQKSYLRSVQILKNQYTAGMIARADVIQAETQLKQVQIQQIEMQRERNLQENVLAVLQGKSVVQFQLVKRQQGLSIPTVPA